MVCIVSVYAPCGSTACKNKTYYQKNERYINDKRLKTNLEAMLKDSLLNQLHTWRASNKRVVLTLDAHENVLDEAMCM